MHRAGNNIHTRLSLYLFYFRKFGKKADVEVGEEFNIELIASDTKIEDNVDVQEF